MSRLLIVSNRLPVTVSTAEDRIELVPSTGGLATGLNGCHNCADSLWIGWPGKTWTIPTDRREELDRKLGASGLHGVHLTEDDVRGYYDGFSNGVVWPLFHYLLDQVSLNVAGWDAYVRVNARFAEEVARLHRSGDTIWVHDYQLLLAPAMIRELIPDARIGLFLHIPFPASAVLRALPHRERILRGMLGADLVGFHTHSYVRHFAAALLRVLGQETVVDTVLHDGREVRMGSFPMGIDARAFAALARKPSVTARAEEIRGTDACRVLVGIDRLDYTKGIPRRLLAFEELLRAHPELHGNVRLVQVAVPSRSEVRAYRQQRESVDELVGRINGAFGTATWSPVHYMHRSLPREEVVALYLAADVMLVTPIRDGMNLVAKEFVAARNDLGGVLVLSEFAGAAAELAGALHINPFDRTASAEILHKALEMPRKESIERMRALRACVNAADSTSWAESFLGALDVQSARNRARPADVSPVDVIDAALLRMQSAAHLLLLLDYDGTLVPFAALPDMARPDAELDELLTSLSDLEHTEVHIVSGRSRADLERWFGDMSIALHAEHGSWSRRAGGAWRRHPIPGLPHAARIESMLQEFATRTPGAFIESKSNSIAWHWRRADPRYGAQQANELRLHLAELLSNVGVEVVCGDRVIEVRPYGMHKGVIVPSIIDAAPHDALVVAFGDDRTDEDLFAALPAEGIAFHIGPNPSAAGLRLRGPDDARALLAQLVQQRAV